MRIIECREENGQGERKKRAEITESKVLLASMTFAHVRKLPAAKDKTETEKTQREIIKKKLESWKSTPYKIRKLNRRQPR